MEQRDYIMAQIEQLGRVLARLMADFTGYKLKGQVSFGIEVTRQEMITELDIDPNEILTLGKDELKNYLEHRKCNSKHLELLSDYLRGVGEYYLTSNKMQAKPYFETSVELLQQAEGFSKTMSFVRKTKIEALENIMKRFL